MQPRYWANEPLTIKKAQPALCLLGFFDVYYENFFFLFIKKSMYERNKISLK